MGKIALLDRFLDRFVGPFPNLNLPEIGQVKYQIFRVLYDIDLRSWVVNIDLASDHEGQIFISVVWY